MAYGGGAFLPNENATVTGTWTFTSPPTFGSTSSGSGAVGSVPSAVAATVFVSEQSFGFLHQTTLTLAALPLTLSDTHVGGGVKIYTFPEGNITMLGATASVAETTTSTILTTLNGGKTLSVGLGSVQTVAQDSGTLVTTEQDILNAFAPVSSTVINVAAAAATGSLSATTCIKYDGTATAQAVYFNCGVPTATDIDADATTTWRGTIVLTWVYNGDV